MKIKELLNKKGKWTQNWFAIDAFGNRVSSTSLKAIKWCLMGAVSKCYKKSQKQKKLSSKLRINLG